MSTTIALSLLWLAAAAPSGAISVAGSKHDLSITGPGTIHAVTETNACVFCHVVHSGRPNRPDLLDVHRPYESTTMSARPGAPTGATRVCLSCHDGTIAVGDTRTRRIAMTMDMIPSDRPANLGTDLRRTHPVSFRPLPTPRTRQPVRGDAVALDRSGQVQCTSCHDPHRETAVPDGKFLVKTTRASALCLSCHEARVYGSGGASHASSTATLPPGAEAPAGTSLAEAGCAACHRPHSAAVEGRLLPTTGGDDAPCLRCHGASVAARNVGIDAGKPYTHAGFDPTLHDAGEGRPGSRRPLPEASPGAARHASCVDCHDPHLANADRPIAPGAAGGALAGVWGIDRNGRRVDQVRYEYEVCFKCHADSANQPQAAGPRPPETVRRAVTEVNLRRVFDPAAPSGHPVVGTRRRLDLPGLKAPWDTAMQLACSDCHASDTGAGAGGPGARGPHGSVHAYLLERSYSTSDYTPETPSAYALCYKCHEREVLLSASSGFPLHSLHLSGERPTACSTCHSGHGVSQRAAGPMEGAHLVDFDVSVVKAGASGVRRYQSAGARQGSCTLSCHAQDHAGASYSPSSALTMPGGALRLAPARSRR